MTYLKLFWSFFQIGLFSFGGGYAAMPLIQHQVVDLNGWLTMREFADVITISQMTPGPIGINSASFVGIRIGGVPGAVIATLAYVLPSCVILLILASIYYKYRGVNGIEGVLSGLRPAVTAMIGVAGLDLLILAFWNGKGISLSHQEIDYVAVGIFVVALIMLRRWKASSILVMVGAGIAGLCMYGILILAKFQ